MEVTELESEVPAIRVLGSLFKLTEVHLWDDDSVEARQVLPIIDSTILFQDDQNDPNSASTITEVDEELVEQMNAMGLPLSFHTNKERTRLNGVKRRNVKTKHTHSHQTIEGEVLDSDKVSEEMSIFHTTSDNSSNSFSCKSMHGKSESSYCDIAENVSKGQPLPDEVEYSVSLTTNAFLSLEIFLAGAQISDAGECDFSLGNVLTKDVTVTESRATNTHDETSEEHYMQSIGAEYVEETLDVGLIENAHLEGPTLADQEGEKSCHDAVVGLSKHSDNVTGLQLSNEVYCDEVQSNYITAFGDWEAYWDAIYMRNYFYNIKTQESTWIAPSGMENLALENVANEAKQIAETIVFPSGPVSIQDSNVIYPCSCPYYVDVSEESKDGGLPQFPYIETPDGFELVADNFKDAATTEKKKKIKRRQSHRKSSIDREELQFQGILEELSSTIEKYWHQRYLLFSKFDKGIKMDEEGWFSVTPECIARHHASRCGSGILVDFFAGVGGNSIQFAKRCNHVIAIDIDPKKVEYAQSNAAIYGVADCIEFIMGDSFLLAPKLKADTVFLSPPWGGPDYVKSRTYDIMTMLKPHDGLYLFNIARGVASKVVMFLPKTVDINQLAELSLSASPPWSLEVEKNFLNGQLKAITAYFSAPST